MIEKHRVIEYTNKDITELQQSWHEATNTNKRVRLDLEQREFKDEYLASVSEKFDIKNYACVEIV